MASKESSASGSSSTSATVTVDEVCEFLATRGVDKSVIDTFLQEKMDGVAVMYASDTALQEFGLTAKGDLYALKAFCEKKINCKSVVEKEPLRNKLLQQLLNKRRKKISLLGSSSKAVEGKIKTRKFILGWLHFRAEKGKYVMVRTPDGGGTRDVELPHDSAKEDIIDYATGMFFVGGSSKFGAAEHMEFDLGNFRCEKISDITYADGSTKDFTLARYFEATKLKKARLYLMSMLKDPVGEIKRPRTSSSGDDSGEEDLMKATFSDDNSEKDKEIKAPSRLETGKPVNVPHGAGDESAVIVTFEDHAKQLHTRKFTKEEKAIAVYDWVGRLQPMPWFVLYFEDQNEYIPPTDSVTVMEHRLVHAVERSQPVAISDDPEVTFKGFAVSGKQDGGRTEDLPASPVALFEVQDKPPSNFMMVSDSSDSEREHSDSDNSFSGQQVSLEERARQWRASLMTPPTHELPSRKMEDLRQKLYSELASDEPIKVSRRHVLADLLRYYSKDDVASSTIKVTFTDEQGEDFGGLTQDLFSAFWEQALDMYFDGEEVKVPFASPSNLHGSQSTFEAMGKIFSHGFILTGAIPVQFCQSSVMGAFLGSQRVPEPVLLRDLFNHVSEREAKVMSIVMSAAGKEDVTDEQEDILFSVFARFEMRIAPVLGERLRDQLVKLARFIFVLRPLCILQWMVEGIPKNQMEDLWSQLNQSDFDSLYEALKPTIPRVLESLHTEGVLKPEEEVAFYYLKDFLANMDQELLQRFLRFVTGRPSASLCPINVCFNRAEGLARTPKAQTCSKCLIISVCYSTLSEFKKEFTNVLFSDEAFEMHSA